MVPSAPHALFFLIRSSLFSHLFLVPVCPELSKLSEAQKTLTDTDTSGIWKGEQMLHVQCSRGERPPYDAVDTPGSASGCHVVLQNHEGTGPTVGSRGVIWGMVSPFHPVQVPLHVQMKDTHKTNNPGYFLS